MSLPANQQRVLDGMERALQASEPHMASMYAIFARLHEGTEPVGAEPLKPRRWRGLQPGAGQSGRGMYAMALIPVLFVMVVAGVLLGGSAHGLTTCGSGSAAFGGSPWVTRSSCQTAGQTTAGLTNSGSATAGRNRRIGHDRRGPCIRRVRRIHRTQGIEGPEGRRGPLRHRPRRGILRRHHADRARRRQDRREAAICAVVKRGRRNAEPACDVLQMSQGRRGLCRSSI
jgi:hypothetical protein